METYALAFGLIAFIALHIKIRYHMIYFFHKNKKPYPGFFNSFLKLPLYQLPFIFLPIPMVESLSNRNAIIVLITSLITIISLAIFVIIAEYAGTHI